jgi:hypothetical protein
LKEEGKTNDAKRVRRAWTLYVDGGDYAPNPAEHQYLKQQQ